MALALVIIFLVSLVYTVLPTAILRLYGIEWAFVAVGFNLFLWVLFYIKCIKKSDGCLRFALLSTVLIPFMQILSLLKVFFN